MSWMKERLNPPLAAADWLTVSNWSTPSDNCRAWRARQSAAAATAAAALFCRAAMLQNRAGDGKEKNKELCGGASHLHRSC